MLDSNVVEKIDNFLNALSHAHADASAQNTIFQKYYNIAGFVIKLQFLSEAFACLLTPALAHTETATTIDPDLTINIWDSATTHAVHINFPWLDSFPHYSLRGEVFNYNTDDVFTVVDKHTGALTVLDKRQNVAYYWVDDIKNLPWWVSGSPLQLILHWWMRDKGLQLTHSGAVGYSNGGVLLAGSGGVGKSTTTQACLRQGMQFVSEDYCLLGNMPKLYAHCVYSSAKLEQNTMNFFPELENNIVNTDRAENEKAFLFQHDFCPEKIIPSFPVKAILILKIQPTSETWLEEAAAESALKALSVSTMWQLTHTGRETFTLLKQATESVPCYFLHLGSDLNKIPKVIKGLL